MLPFPRLIQYGNSTVPSENIIITFLKTGGTLTKTNINESPTDYYTHSYNAIQFNSGQASIQVGSNGIPAIWQIGNSTNFRIETYVKLTNTSAKILCGNLNNSNGSGSWWLTINNVYQVSAAISLDGYSTTGAIQRFRFTGMTTLPINVWNQIVLERIGSTLTCYINGTSIGSTTMTLGFQVNSNAFRVGNSVDNAYSFNGIIDSFHMTMNT